MGRRNISAHSGRGKVGAQWQSCAMECPALSKEQEGHGRRVRSIQQVARDENVVKKPPRVLMAGRSAGLVVDWGVNGGLPQEG